MNKVPTILCVDNDPVVLCLVTALFEKQGYSVLSTDDPKAALEMAKQRLLSLAVLDYELPHMNGAVLAQNLKRISPEVPVLLFSGAVAIPLHELGAIDQYIAKGENPGALLLNTRRLLEPARTAAANA